MLTPNQWTRRMRRLTVMSLFPFSTIERNDGEIPVPSATSASETPRDRRSCRSRVPRSFVPDARSPRHGSTGVERRGCARILRHAADRLDAAGAGGGSPPRARRRGAASDRRPSSARARPSARRGSGRRLADLVGPGHDTRADPPHEPLGVAADLEVDDPLPGIGDRRGRTASAPSKSDVPDDPSSPSERPSSSRAPTRRGGAGSERYAKAWSAVRRAERRRAVDEVRGAMTVRSGGAGRRPPSGRPLLPDPQLPEDVLLAVLVRVDVVERGAAGRRSRRSRRARRRPRS